jgi:hypothetical protein
MMVDRWRFEPHVIGARRGISADPEYRFIREIALFLRPPVQKVESVIEPLLFPAQNTFLA